MKIQDGRIMNDFIEPNKRQYSIPVYQRNYEWSDEQCKKLFSDIIEAHKKDRTHFCGSIVYSLLKEENNINHFVIIDGQQRLTTIYLLLKALMDSTELESEKHQIFTTLYNEDKFKSYGWDEASKLKLKPIKSDNAQLELLMSNKFEKLNQNSDIYKNYILFKQLIKDYLDKDITLTIPRIYDGLEKLTCARISLEAEDSPQEVFERINSTGLPLSLSDKIRNFVLMTDADQDRLFESYWLPIENNVKRNKMSSFFLDYLNMQIDGFTKELTAYDDFKTYYKGKNYTNESMLEELKYYSEFYKAFQGGKNNYSSKVNELLSGLRNLKQTTIYCFLFKVFDDYESSIFNEKELEKILEFFLNYSIRRLVCEVGSNSLRGLYKTLYKRIFNNLDNKNYYYDAIVSFFTQLNSGDKFPTDQEFDISLREKDLYHKLDLRKYLLSTIENSNSKEKIEISSDITIEHIMPQKLSTEWQNMLGDDWQNIHMEYLHTLGNLTLTGYNSELSNSPFNEKRKLLEEKAVKIKTLNIDVLNQNTWDLEHIKNRAKRLSNIIITIFSYPIVSTQISFQDPRYKDYGLNPDDATNKHIEYFVLQGEKIFVDSFAGMLKIVIKKIYDQDPSIIEEMAMKNERLAKWSKKVIFSYDPTIITGKKLQIAGTDIYEAAGLSAWYIIEIIRKLLEKYGIDATDFSYSARDLKQ
ncbi:MAG: DUF262 domain-containing HNH endonuclease family protein [Candidatus Saccharibacteria bacterium]|nr:DUF262 domain-containing HNH endonuclease family protein [Candidatus Saccharibacteria bacterium]